MPAGYVECSIYSKSKIKALERRHGILWNSQEITYAKVRF